MPKSQSFPKVRAESAEINCNLGASTQCMSERTKECDKWQLGRESYVVVILPAPIHIMPANVFTERSSDGA